jgi:hypothetical protein
MSIVYGTCCISGADPGLQEYQEKTTDHGGNRSTRRKPPTVEETGLPGENHRPWRKPEYQEKTTDRGGNRRTRRKPLTLEETGVPGENHRPWRKPEYQEKTTDSGGNRSTRRKPLFEYEINIFKLICRPV